MDLTDAAFFATFLHCVYTAPIDFLPQIPNPFEESYIPERSVVPPPYSELTKPNLSEISTFYTSHWPSPLNEPEPILKDEEKREPNGWLSENTEYDSDRHQQQYYKTGWPSTTQKEGGLSHTLISPHVKLGFRGLNGMVPQRKTHENPNTPRPRVVVAKPIEPKRLRVSDKRGNFINFKKIQGPLFRPEQPDRPYDKVLPYQLKYTTPPPKTELPYIVQNPQIVYTTASGKKYTEYQENNEHKLKLKANNPTAYRDPEIERNTKLPQTLVRLALNIFKDRASRKDRRKQDQQGAQKENDDYLPPPPVGKKRAQKENDDYLTKKPCKKGGNVQLPPVPSVNSPLRQLQFSLLNTVAGLPGGNTAAFAGVLGTS